MHAGLRSALARGPRLSPSDMSGALYAWWDPSSVMLNAGAIETWVDRVGGLSPTQATASKRPGYLRDGYQGRAWTTWDGVNHFLEAAGTGVLPIGPTPCEIIGLVDQQATDAAARRLFCYGGATNTVARWVGRSGSNLATVTIGDGSVAQVATLTTPLIGRHVLRLQISATGSIVAMDGGETAAVASIPATTTVRTRIGSHTQTTAAQFWQGLIGDILVTRPLTDTQFAGLSRYLLL